jgi:hypothetical protein
MMIIRLLIDGKMYGFNRRSIDIGHGIPQESSFIGNFLILH